MVEISFDIRRQIGVFIDRFGKVVLVIIGDEKEIFIPELTNYAIGKKALRGVRLIHTHLKNEALTQDDLTDLAMLRLDMIGAIGVGADKLPKTLYTAHLLPMQKVDKVNKDGQAPKAYEVSEPIEWHLYDVNVEEFLGALEDEMGRSRIGVIKDGVERAVLVSVSTGNKQHQLERLEELENLSETAGIEVIDTLMQRPQKINPKYIVGTGKIKELIIKALQAEATILIFDRELSPTQIREITKICELKVIDRTQLILDIFAKRATSRDGKVQVELAQLKYMLPKLSGKGTSMSRLAGGIGGRGPGETKLEVDKRRVQDRISHLSKILKTLSKGRKVRRSQRGKTGVPIISIVGYTNAGKSTFLNTLTKSDVLAEDKLFATLETSTRRLKLPKDREIVITDTVGFITDMPKDLKTAFKATFEEMEDADLLVHLVDVGSDYALEEDNEDNQDKEKENAAEPQFEKKIDVVNSLLEEMKLDNIPMELVFNKIDLLPKAEAAQICRRHKALGVSALDRKTFEDFLNMIERKFWGK